jgi:hypothetical protein
LTLIKVQSGGLFSVLDVSSLINLKRLEADFGNISLLNVNGLSNLEWLSCSFNKLSFLNLNGLTKLDYLGCDNNQLTTLNLNGLTNIRYLQCYKNNLKNLDVSGYNKLNYLDCYENQLNNLNVSNCTNLLNLNCCDNSLFSLDISSLTNLEELCCGNNVLHSIFMKNGINNSNILSNPEYYYFNNNIYLKYICVDVSDILSLRTNIINNGFSNVIINSFCSTTLNGSYYTINGNTKYDSNNNGCTAQDANYTNLKIKIKNATDSGYAFSNSQGNFAMVLDSGTYTLTPQLPNTYFNITPSSTTITFPEDTIPQQFCITPNGTHHDISVTIIPIRAARPGFSDATYKIVLKNVGNLIESGTILFSYDEDIQDFISATVTPNNLVNGELSFNFSSLQLFETREILVTMRTNSPSDVPAINTGDVIGLSVNANINTDENLDDNSQLIKQTVVGSFDPNDKTCLEGKIITPNIVGDFVNYLIRFENTGTANAENVVVTDFIDLTKFDISTLEITSTSHSCKTVISNGNKVQFVFDNINLPFTEPLKHGYVAFKIKTKSNLIVGDSLTNHADIYFDYNLPIKTNTATTKVATLTAVKSNAKKEGSLSVYPNPSIGDFTINFESKGNFPLVIKLIDMKGSIVLEKNLQHQDKSNIQIHQNDLPSGIYQVNIISEKEYWTQKLQILK